MDEEEKILESIEASELINEVISIHNHSAREKAIAFNTNNVKVEFCADRNQMKSVFSNLLFNAIKYSKRGSEVDVSIMQVNQDVVFKITDSGKGIDPKVLDNLNGRHRVISEKGTGSERGTGIGLRIVNDFVEDHGGSLHFMSNEIGGTTVSVVIPIAQPSASQLEESSQHQL